ncbi:MAG TPA: DUF4055 domain-containing protein, partial [Terricaulis sp.]|nr:DUF4055 domain-containing protein [Terricaulis sp.]
MWTANPTPWFAGVQSLPTDENGMALDGSKPAIRLGSSEAILLEKDGEAGYLEFSGAGLKQISETLARKAKDMAALGARLLADDQRSNVTAETARIQRAGESSTLGRISSVASSGLTYVLRELAQWAGVSSGLDA